MCPHRRVLAVVLCMLMTGIVVGPGQAQPPSLVVTEPLGRLEFHDQLILIGRSQARAESHIVSAVSGRVLKINALEGRWISRGDMLVTIDSRRIALGVDGKKAEAAQAMADAELATKELARAENLFEQDILPERTLDGARATATRTRERYNQLEAERKQLEFDLYNTGIRAPYSGHTIRYLVQVGEWVSPGTPVYDMVDLSVVKVTVDLPERRFGQVEIGGAVAIYVSGDTDAPMSGTVSGIAPQASQATHTFPVIVSVPNPDGRLGSGMLLRAAIGLKGRFSSFAVSKDAIVRQGDRTIIYTIVDGKAAPIAVRTTSSQGTMVAVEGEGLEDGMPVVVRGNERIFPGSPVQTQAVDEAVDGEPSNVGEAEESLGDQDTESYQEPQ